ncbi:Os01g0502900, partial [Oryza sativa Japonica Group]
GLLSLCLNSTRREKVFLLTNPTSISICADPSRGSSDGAQGREEAGGEEAQGGEAAVGVEGVVQGGRRRRQEGEEEGEEERRDLHLQGPEAGAPGHRHLLQGHTSVRLVLPGELAKHAVSEGTKAVTKFTSN